MSRTIRRCPMLTSYVGRTNNRPRNIRKNISLYQEGVLRPKYGRRFSDCFEHHHTKEPYQGFHLVQDLHEKGWEDEKIISHINFKWGIPKEVLVQWVADEHEWDEKWGPRRLSTKRERQERFKKYQEERQKENAEKRRAAHVAMSAHQRSNLRRYRVREYLKKHGLFWLYVPETHKYAIAWGYGRDYRVEEV